MLEKNLLNDDDIMNVSGGMEVSHRMGDKKAEGNNEDPMTYGRCRCGGFLKKDRYSNGYRCTSCQQLYDANKKPIELA